MDFDDFRSDLRSKARHMVLGDRLAREGRHEEATTHFRLAAELEDAVLGKLVSEERDDWVVNAVSLLWCWRKAGDKSAERRTAAACLRLLETMPVDESFSSYADEIREWKVAS